MTGKPRQKVNCFFAFVFNADNTEEIPVLILPTILKLALFFKEYPRSCKLQNMFGLESVFLRVLEILNLCECSFVSKLTWIGLL